MTLSARHPASPTAASPRRGPGRFFPFSLSLRTLQNEPSVGTARSTPGTAWELAVWAKVRGGVIGTLAFLALGLGGVAVPRLKAEGTELTVFVGGAGQRVNVLRNLLDTFQARHPGVTVKINTGAATSELQRQYLSTLLNAQDSTYDAFLIDIVNPAEYSAAGWLEPLDGYYGDQAGSILDAFVPAQREANRVNGKVVALPWVLDAQFLYYRKDLLDKYHLSVPNTWAELAAAAKTVLAGEHSPTLAGLSIQGAPIEGTVCTFLVPYWSQGKQFLDAQGKLTLDRPAALAAFQLWRDLLAQGVLKPNTAETKTGDTTNEFKAGNALFAVNWGYAWGVAQRDPDSLVRGKIGLTQVPALGNGLHVSTVGGWQWAVSAYSRHKPEAVDLVRYLTSKEALKTLVLQAAVLPPRTDLYTDKDIVAQFPLLPLLYPVVLSAKARPITPRYSEVSDVLRTTTSAVLGGSLTPEAGVDAIESQLSRVLR